MKRHTALFSAALLTLICILGNLIDIPAAEYGYKYHVLFLSSYSYAWDMVPLQIEGIKNEISDDILLDYEFMDTKRFPDAESIEIFYEGLAYRMSKSEPYDAVITGDDAALHFAIEHHDDLFEGLPIIFEGVNNVSYAMEVSKDPLVTGIIEALSVPNNIDFALTLYPDADTVISILDDTLTGEAERACFYDASKLYPDLTFKEIDCSVLTTDEIIAALSSIPDNTILLYQIMTEDASGSRYNNEQAVKLITAYANVPVLRMVYGGIGDGLLGGNIVSLKLSGELAAKITSEIVHGKDPSSYSVIDSTNIYCIDEAVMKKYGLSLKLIPDGAEIINHTPSFFEKYSIIMIPITIIISLLIIIIVILLLRTIQQLILNRELTVEKRQLTKDSTCDFLTGLFNRSKLYSDLNVLNKSHTSCALFIFDIDSFKHINDTYGHAAGDDVLTELGRRISSIKNPAFTPYRLAGDEFICIYRTRDHEKIDECARHCMKLFEPDFELNGMSLSVKISLGIAVSPDDCNDLEKLIECADKAMYTVKKNGKNSYAWYGDIK